MERMRRWIAAGTSRLLARGARAVPAVLALLALSSGAPRSAHALLASPTAQIAVTIGVKDVFPPTAVTDLLAAVPFSQEDRIALMWTAPSEDNLPVPSNLPV